MWYCFLVNTCLLYRHNRIRIGTGEFARACKDKQINVVILQTWQVKMYVRYFVWYTEFFFYSLLGHILGTSTCLKVNLGLGREYCQHAVIDEFLCMVTGCALGTDVCHWMFNKKSQHGSRSTRFPFKEQALGWNSWDLGTKPSTTILILFLPSYIYAFVRKQVVDTEQLSLKSTLNTNISAPKPHMCTVFC